MNSGSIIKGHLLAFFTIIVWGTTFISTKVLLVDFTPIEILLYRFVLGFFLLTILSKGGIKWTDIKQEGVYAGAGICGITLYYLFENIALDYTLASNVGIIVSVSPFFIGILSYLFVGRERLRANFFIGFIVAMIGIGMIYLNGNIILELNPIGDLLALLSAVVWGVYSILIKKAATYGYTTIQVTQRVFLYGLLFTLPTLFFLPFEFDFSRFASPVNLANMLFLGLGASAICFVTWNVSIKILGAVKAGVYIYLIPTIAVITAVIVLSEPVTWIMILGMILTLMGLLISEKVNWKKHSDADL